jgi:hypothetical protein
MSRELKDLLAALFILALFGAWVFGVPGISESALALFQ